MENIIGIKFKNIGYYKLICFLSLADLLAAEQTEIYKAKSAGSHITGHFEENDGTLKTEEGGRQDFGEINYYVTQLLSRHGYFRKYLHRMGKTAYP